MLPVMVLAGREQGAEVPVLLLLQTKEPGVAHRHRGRTREQGHQLDVLLREGASLPLLDEHETADHAAVAEAQRHRQGLDLAPLLHGLPVGRVELRVADTGHEALSALDDRHVPGALVEAQASAEPRLVLRRRVPRPDGRAGERPAGRVVLVEVALPHVERLGDALRDHRRRVGAGERPRDLGAGLDGEAHAVAAAHRRHDAVRWSLGARGRGATAPECGHTDDADSEPREHADPPVDALSLCPGSLPEALPRARDKNAQVARGPADTESGTPFSGPERRRSPLRPIFCARSALRHDRRATRIAAPGAASPGVWTRISVRQWSGEEPCATVAAS